MPGWATSASRIKLGAGPDAQHVAAPHHRALHRGEHPDPEQHQVFAEPAGQLVEAQAVAPDARKHVSVRQQLEQQAETEKAQQRRARNEARVGTAQQAGEPQVEERQWAQQWLAEVESRRDATAHLTPAHMTGTEVTHRTARVDGFYDVGRERDAKTVADVLLSEHVVLSQHVADALESAQALQIGQP